MRDIKSSKPNRKKHRFAPRDDFDESDMELYDVAEQMMSKAKKKLAPIKRLAPIERDRRNTKYKQKNKTTKTKKARKWAGSKVPLTTIHAKPIIKAKRGGRKKPVGKPRKQKFSMLTQKKGSSKGFKKASKVRVGKGERMILLFIFGLVLIAALVAVVIFLPTATLEVQLRTAPLLVDEEIVIAADGSSQVVPGTSFWREVNVQDAYNVQSREKVGTKAGGTVTIVNNTVDEQPIKERSRLVTKDGQLFYMLKHAIVPPKSSAPVEVEAAEAGDEGNIEAQRLNFAALDESSQSLVYAEASEGLSGGSGDEISVVGESDIEGAKDMASEIARGQAEGAIKGELPEGWTLLDESWTAEVTEFKSDAKVGDKVATIPYTAKVTIRVMGYEQDVLQDKLRAELESQLDEEFMLFPGQISYSKSVKDVDWDEARAVIAARVTHTTIPRLSLDSLRSKVAGRSVKETKEYLEGLPGVRMVTIETWPFWVNSIPRIEKRVTLDLQPERQP